MDAINPLSVPKVERRFLPALAEAITDWFPALEGRALAVSDASITKENVPKLPLVMVAFATGVAMPPARSRSDQFEMTDTFVIEFWLEPMRLKKANGAETPFWSYYDYEDVRDTLLNNIVRWQAPNGERVAFRSMAVQADALAVTITFNFIATHMWCAPRTDFGEPFSISYALCTPEACVPDTCYEDIDPCHPCP